MGESILNLINTGLQVSSDLYRYYLNMVFANNIMHAFVWMIALCIAGYLLNKLISVSYGDDTKSKFYCRIRDAHHIGTPGVLSDREAAEVELLVMRALDKLKNENKS